MSTPQPVGTPAGRDGWRVDLFGGLVHQPDGPTQRYVASRAYSRACREKAELEAEFGRTLASEAVLQKAAMAELTAEFEQARSHVADLEAELVEKDNEILRLAAGIEAATRVAHDLERDAESAEERLAEASRSWLSALAAAFPPAPVPADAPAEEDQNDG